MGGGISGVALMSRCSSMKEDCGGRPILGI